jgi:5-methylcytosine-specific restriction endonuclease McrA
MAPRRRDWTQARAKVDREAQCRVCGDGRDLQAAHTIGRTYDPIHGKVQAIDIVPLCPGCHRQYDGRTLNLLPYLSHDEQAAAVGHVGIISALRRLTNER